MNRVAARRGFTVIWLLFSLRDFKYNVVLSFFYPAPVFYFQHNETMYLVAMLDPDTPSFTNPLCRHWVHFIFGNVKVSKVSYIKGSFR